MKVPKKIADEITGQIYQFSIYSRLIGKSWWDGVEDELVYDTIKEAQGIIKEFMEEDGGFGDEVEYIITKTVPVFYARTPEGDKND